jgi:hypothetical protein
MKKADSPDPVMRDSYERGDFPGGLVRGKYYRALTRAVVLDPDVAAAFPTSEAVNDALRSLIQATKPQEG